MIKIIKNVIKTPIINVYSQLIRHKYRKMVILSRDDTIRKIMEDRVSIARFGDGEFKWLLGIAQSSFQNHDEGLSMRLKEVLADSETANMLICIPEIFKREEPWTASTRNFWRNFFYNYQADVARHLDIAGLYGCAAGLTRCYMEYENKESSLVAERFNSLKQVWHRRNILIVEGETTKLGVGNDLFSEAKSIKRILCPSVNAYDVYSDILSSVREFTNDIMVIISLGPTATVLSYDLCKEGYQALDLGHIDIEYEWFLAGATEKVSIPGKYVNESDNRLINSTGSTDSSYSKQVVINLARVPHED